MFPEFVHVHQLHLVIVVRVPDFDRSCVCDLVDTSPTHLSYFASCSVAQSATAISVSVLRMVSLTGTFGSAHDAGEGADENDADRWEAGTNDADVDFDVGPVHNIDLIPCWICGRGESD